MTRKGSITAAIFLEWLKRFATAVTLRPLVLLVDCHSSRFSLDVIEFCRANDIHLLALLPNCTRILQPLDRVVFAVLKYWQRALRWAAGRTPAGVHRLNIIGTITPALLKALQPHLIQASWRRAGLYPLNIYAIRDGELALKYRARHTVTTDDVRQLLNAYRDLLASAEQQARAEKRVAALNPKEVLAVRLEQDHRRRTRRPCAITSHLFHGYSCVYGSRRARAGRTASCCRSSSIGNAR